MRLSSNTIYEVGTNMMLQQQEALIKTQQQLSTGKRIVTPSDDPIAAAQALNITQAAALNEQYSVNRKSAGNSLMLEENVLKEITSVLQDVHQAVVSAGNASYSDADRKARATELRCHLESLVTLANSTDDKGQFLFSGYQANTKPFVQSGMDIQYAGDQGQRLTQVSSSRQLAISDAGADVFERIMNGNGIFKTAADPLNTGTGIIDVGSVIDPTSLTGDQYEINFTVTNGATTFDVVNTTTGTSVFAGNPYTNNHTISVDGMQLSIKGEPANGDKFTVSPSNNQSIFETVSKIVTALETPSNGQPGGARLTNILGATLKDIESGLEHVLAKQTAIGARLQEIDTLDSVGSDQDIQFQQSLAELQGVDFAKAISDLQRQQLYLQAAQQSYIKVSGLTLFNFL